MALQNHESARKMFPSGGIDPWPRIEDYADGGKPFGAPKQGLSWAFQILPYLEQGAVHNLVDSVQLPLTKVDLYFCPSRRGPTQNPNSVAGVSDRWLMDYAALVGSSARSSIGNPDASIQHIGATDEARYDEFLANGSLCNQTLLWGGNIVHMDAGTKTTYDGNPTRRLYPTEGVIVRSSYFVHDGTGAAGHPVVHNLGLPGPTSFRQITDGASNTIVLCEKRIAVARYGGASVDDDAGWSDGWDYDTLRLAYCQPASDSDVVKGPGGGFMTAGAAHTGVFFCAFADGSVHGLNYDIDLETFNKLANKADGEVVEHDF